MKTTLNTLLVILVLHAGIGQLTAQGTTAFTYQGQLRDGGTNANGPYTMTFKLYDASNAGNQVAGTGTLTTNLTFANGLFTVTLDFGLNAFDGRARWLDITVAQGSDTQTLSPRVQILPAPYALFAATAGTVTNGAIMSTQLASDPASISRVTAGAAFTAINNFTGDPTIAFSGGMLTLTNHYPFPSNSHPVPPYSTNGWTGRSEFQFINSYFASFFAGCCLQEFTPTLNLVAPQGYLLMTIAPTNTAVTEDALRNIPRRGNIFAGKFFGNGSGLTDVSAIPRIQPYVEPGTYEFVVPPSVTRIMVEMWGAGGGGGNGLVEEVVSNPCVPPDPPCWETNIIMLNGGGGGGGGYIQHSFSVIPGSTNFIRVGQGGNRRQNGTDTTLTNLPIVLLAGGGEAGEDGTLSEGYGDGGAEGIASGAPIAIWGEPGRPWDHDESVNGGASFRSVRGGPGTGGYGGFGNLDPVARQGDVGEHGAVFIYY